MSGFDEVITYRDVARWLPQDIREQIEVGVPCMGGGEHDWHHQSVDISTAESASTRTEEWWSCTRRGCNLTVKTLPAAVEVAE